MRRLPLIAIVLCLGLFAGPAWAAEGDALKDLDRLQRLREQVDVHADAMDYDAASRRLVARGRVRFAINRMVVAADEMFADLESQQLTARGNATLDDGANRLEGEEIEYDLRKSQGKIVRARGVLSPGLHFTGAEIRRVGEREFHLTKGGFTSCLACQPAGATPDWEFRAAEASIHLDEYVIADHASFWVKGIPLFYVPRLIVPVHRRTGFLIPSGGVGGGGVTATVPFFWAISSSQDLTFWPTYRTKRGPDFLAEYRYRLSEDSGGAMKGRYLYDTEQDLTRSEFRWQHDQGFTPALRFKADVNYLSDDVLARDFVDSTVADRTQRTMTSNLFLEQTTAQYLAVGRVAADNDLSSSEASRGSYLPEGRFQWLPTMYADGWLVGEGDLAAAYLERNRSVDFGRFDLAPAVHLPLDLGPGLAAASSLRLRETAYTDSQVPEGSRNRVLVEFQERLAARRMRRFGLARGRFQQLTHVVEPSLTYQYLPWVDQRALPQFDSVDFVSPQNRLTFRLGNRLMARVRETEGPDPVSELASFAFEQSLNLQPRVREFSDVYLTGLTPERVDQALKNVRPLGGGFSQAQERVWSNTVLSGQINPHPMVGLRGVVAVNPEAVRTDGVSAGASFNWPGLLQVNLDHTFVRNQQASGFVATAIVQAARGVSLDYLTRYEALSGTFMEHGIGVRFSRSCCWDLTLRYTHRSELETRAADNEFRFAVDIKMPTPPSGRSLAERPTAGR